MKIRSFEVWNFKSIEYSKKILFPKISILIGPNNSGKSSIVQSLLLMKQTIEAEEPSIPLVLNGPETQLGEYKDFIHGEDLSRPFIIKFNFEKDQNDRYICEVCGKGYKQIKWLLKHVEKNHPSYWTKKKGDISKEAYHLPKNPSLRFQYRFNPKTSTIILQELELKNPNHIEGLILSAIKLIQLKSNRIRIQAISRNEKPLYTRDYKLPKNIEVDHNSMVHLFNRFMGGQHYLVHGADSKEKERISLLEDDLGNVLDSISFEKISRDRFHLSVSDFESVYRKLNDEQKLAVGLLRRLNMFYLPLMECLEDVKIFLQDIRHIGPLRNWPERIYFGTGGKPTTVGVKGEFTQDIIWRDFNVEHKTLINNINNWLEKLNFGFKLEVYSLGIGGIYQLRVIENDLSVNIVDIGFGLSQILPILAECINFSLTDIRRDKRVYFPFFFEEKSDVNRLLITEQPEIHLNPKIQAALGDFFVQIGKSDRTLLIETHSEHLLSRIQRRVADGTLNPEDVIIYYISKQDNKSEIEEISISNKGVFSYWPEGFFQDDFDEAIEILKESLRGNRRGK